MPLSNKYLQQMIDQYESIKINVKNLSEDLTEEHFNKRPGKNKWSVAECIDHLNASYNAYAPIIKNVIENSANDSITNPDEFKSRIFFRFFTSFLEPPYRMKVKTFTIFMPDEKLNKNDTLKKFYNSTNEFIDFINRSEKVDIKKTIITSPVSDKLRFQLGELYPFMAAHIRRHIWQAKIVKKLTS